jgi:hypothetical protein
MDVVVGPNAWIAGPARPSRIEGLAPEWPSKPAGLDIRDAVQFANAQLGSGKMVARRADRARSSVRGVDLETRHTDNVDDQRGLAALEGQLPGLRV